MKSRLLLVALACLASVIVTTVVVAHLVTWSVVTVRDEVGGQIAGVNRRIDGHEKALADLITAVPYRDLQALTVRVDIGSGCGTGVLVTRQIGDVARTFVWTAGHVVSHLRNEDGTFRNATIYRENRENGRYKDKSQVEGKVIAYSDPDVGDDLALLEILQDNFCPVSVSAAFLLDTEISPVGTELVHVGCTLGLYNSVSRGIISQTDRDVLGTGAMFDQTSCMGYPGSSGGGVYRSKDGKCIGLLVRGAGPGVNFIVPTRRMLVWAKKMKIEWAINAAYPVPTHVVRDPSPLTDATEPKPIVTPAPPTRDKVLAAIIDALRRLIRDIAGGSSAYPLEAA
jgi:S1-C subfamily serine protease